MKRIIYILLATILGMLLSIIAVTLIELPVIWLVITDIDKYSFGLSWNDLTTLHLVFSGVMLAVGSIFGVWLGFRWWKYIYIEKKYQGRWFKP